MCRLPKTLGKLLVKTYPLKKQETSAKEPAWTLQLEEWGTQQEIDNFEYSHKKEVPYNRKFPKEKRTITKTETPTAARDNTSTD